MSEFVAFNYESLHAHNGLREAHGVMALQYNEKLANSAQKYAEIIAAKDVLEHSKSEDRDNAGENIAMSMRPFVDYKYSGLGASVSWYSEIKDYDFNKEAQTSKNPTGHFTQVIWKKSKEAGFGRAKNKVSNRWYIVGRYQPAGNFVGEYKENVPRIVKGIQWDKISIINEYLQELLTMEYTGTRKHILDDWLVSCQSGTNAGVLNFEVTETFTTPNGSKYSGSKSFTEDVTKKPRPVFKAKTDKGKPGVGMNNLTDEHEDDNGVYDDQEIKDYIDSLVKNHNICRSKHGSPSLKLDNQLSLYAQDWADELVVENKMNFSNYRFENSQIGENISEKSGNLKEQSAKKLIDSWYKESASYKYGKEPTNFKDIGHFTQVVWKNSKKIGVGVARNAFKKYYIVCFYHPAGNIKNKFTENVLKPK